MTVGNTWAQVADKQAFKELKKLQGVWQMMQNEEKIYEEWILESKNTLRAKKYKIQSADTILLHTATIYYSKFVRFQHQSAIHYHIQALDKDVVYPFRLEKSEAETYTFSNFNNDFPNEIILQLKGNELIVKHISKDKTKEQIWVYQRLK
jgi:hypothetical protein